MPALSESLLQYMASRPARCGRQPKQEVLVMAKSQWTKVEPKGTPLNEIVSLVLEETAQEVIRNKRVRPALTTLLLRTCGYFRSVSELKN